MDLVSFRDPKYCMVCSRRQLYDGLFTGNYFQYPIVSALLLNSLPLIFTPFSNETISVYTERKPSVSCFCTLRFSELAHILGENNRLPEPDKGLSPITEESTSGTAR